MFGGHVNGCEDMPERCLVVSHEAADLPQGM